MRSDAQIQQAVLQELKWDTRVEETDVGVEVDQGVVTLSGAVRNYAKKLAAAQAAHRVAGVLDVANDIQVRVPGSGAPTDTEIAQAVRRALEADVEVPEERIQSTVTSGIVTLTGSVNFWHELEDAGRAVRHLTGVRGLINCLSISAPLRQAEDVRHEIEAALERRADRTAHNIHVTVEDGTATLSGPVHSYAERQAATWAARFAPGVHAVNDRLRIDAYS
jgi:osmotically-inducible protein OsmY